MSVVYALVALQLVTIVAFLAVIYLQDERARAERAELASRIQAPEAARVAAMEAVMPRREAPAPVFEPVAFEGDLAIDDLLERSLG